MTNHFGVSDEVQAMPYPKVMRLAHNVCELRQKWAQDAAPLVERLEVRKKDKEYYELPDYYVFNHHSLGWVFAKIMEGRFTVIGTITHGPGSKVRGMFYENPTKVLAQLEEHLGPPPKSDDVELLYAQLTVTHHIENGGTLEELEFPT